MPHRVSTFLSTSIEAQVANLKKATSAVRRPSPKPRSSTSSTSSSLRHHPHTPTQRTFSYASSLGDDDAAAAADDASSASIASSLFAGNGSNTNTSTTAATTMQTMTSLQTAADGHPSPAVGAAAPAAAAADHHHQQQHHHNRLSFGGLHFGRSSRESHGNPNLALDWQIESPPIVLHGDAESSTGALVSGQLFLTVKEEPVPMEAFTATLNIHVTQKRPFTAHCHDCVHQYTTLQTWSFLPAPLTLTKGRHGFPFSVLLGGHLPASMDGQLVSIAYEFHAEATPKVGAGAGAGAGAGTGTNTNTNNNNTAGGLPVKFEKLFDVKRSLPAPELPHHSVRIFPPTNIKASVHFPQVVYPIGQNSLTLRIDGVARLNPKVNTLEFWKLKKLTWRLEETAKALAPACARHAPRDDGTEESNKKTIQRTDTRVIGEKTLLSGWKSNYAGPDDSVVELELDYALGKHCKYTCDTRTRDGGVEVTHQLMVEMVVSQEWAPASKPSMVTQTGVGRILRMHFNDVLTERGGIGVSWDNEAPPIYQDVPPSPPSYSEEISPAITEQIEPLDGVSV
ncbi:arrestin n-terminal domain containing protein [Niveomyces insectorum RCEF 264]|uniref:Arrestin n-terminal domain containing protein n=1 Tax=Niveomyces insectorum RCEF 264 TaxID=1081102 RepID=A0A167WAL1_9HYPO|nr:arrestin n-terminal domain containing protein [Niveomyces insectorum RCEF 264]